MSSADLHNEDNSSGGPRRVSPFEGLLRAAEHVSPNIFFREILRHFGQASVQRQDVDRALFLFDRVQRARRRLYGAFTTLAAALALPAAGFFVPEPFRAPTLLTGIGLELLLAVAFSFAHRRLAQRRTDYQTWLRVVHRSAWSRRRRGEDGRDSLRF